MTDVPEPCPHCGDDLRGPRIPQESIDKGYYGEPTDEPQYFSKVIGVEVPGVYDGVLYWACPKCGWAWSRFTDGRLGLRSAAIVSGIQQTVLAREAEGKVTP